MHTKANLIWVIKMKENGNALDKQQNAFHEMVVEKP